MIFLPRAVRIYFSAAPCNLRKSFEGLSNEVRHVVGADPLSGHMFVFINRRASQVKILVWTRGGFTIVHKRLEKGQFSFPARLREGVASIEIDVHELSMLLEGLAISRAPSAARWAPPFEARA